MKNSLRTGVCFGTTSGIITTLGLIVGLHAGTHSQLVVIGGIMTIAIADAFSDALGIHISEESKNRNSREVWESTFWTFISKFFFALTFVVPMLLFGLQTAIVVSVFWALSILALISFYVAGLREQKAWKVVLEHMFIAIAVILITHYVGEWIGTTFV